MDYNYDKDNDKGKEKDKDKDRDTNSSKSNKPKWLRVALGIVMLVILLVSFRLGISAFTYGAAYGMHNINIWWLNLTGGHDAVQFGDVWVVSEDDLKLGLLLKTYPEDKDSQKSYLIGLYGRAGIKVVSEQEYEKLVASQEEGN